MATKAHATPKKKSKTVTACSSSATHSNDPTNILYAINNISPLIRSPSKPKEEEGKKNKTSKMWFEFWVQSEKTPTRKCVSCFDKYVDKYLLSDEFKSVINNPTKGIYIKDLHLDPMNPMQYKWSNDTIIGEIVEINKPFNSEYSNEQTIQQILFKARVKTTVSVKANVISYFTNISDSGCVVHKYSLIDNTHIT